MIDGKELQEIYKGKGLKEALVATLRSTGAEANEARVREVGEFVPIVRRHIDLWKTISTSSPDWPKEALDIYLRSDFPSLYKLVEASEESEPF